MAIDFREDQAAITGKDVALADDYRAALESFVLGGAGESGLTAAYQLGRRAVAEGSSILDLTGLHHHTMINFILNSTQDRENAMILGGRFLAEVLAPYETMHRGYTETIQELRKLNESLEQRVTERTRALKESEQKNILLARLYSILSGINSAIVRLRTRDELFQEACRIAVVQGGFPVAWIGVRSDHAIKPIVWHSRRRDGRDRSPDAVDKLISQVSKKNMETVTGNEPVIRHFTDTGTTEPAETPAGFSAFALLPLHVSEEVVAVFALYSTDEAAFDPEETMLLEELAGDLSFALEHIKREEQLNYLAYYDVLTGLPNADLLKERLEQQIQSVQHSGSQVAVLLADLVHFSNINDTYGRHTGDLLLKQVAARLKQSVGPGDTVARMVADRFLVMLTDLGDASQVAHRLERELFSNFDYPFRIGTTEIHLSSQVGITVYPIDASSADNLISNAEVALKRAQQEGRPYLLYDPAMNEQIVRTVTLESKMRKALEEEELTVHYQPKVHAASNQIIGFEALVRFIESDGSLILPGRFIPVLEESGMIIDVGEWVLRRTAEDILHWQQLGLNPPRIAVNVSPIQLRQEDFVDTLKQATGKTGPGWLRLDLEITESAVMEEVEQNIPKLQAVRDMGFRIAIDDFGTGYSSLSYLSRLPVNALKIDRSFIITMTDNPSSLTIVSAIVTLAHSLNLEVVAEGVELKEQAKLLRLLRCDVIQGNLFGRPMSAEQVAELLRKGERRSGL